MESTFKKEYEVQYLANGAMELSFEEKRVGAHQAQMVTKLLVFAVLFVGFWAAVLLTVAMMAVFGDKNIGMKFGFSAALALIGIFFILKKVMIKSSHILVTKEGLIFQNPLAGQMQLAFKDVTDWGIKVDTATGVGYIESAYLYAQAGGKEFRVTKHMPPALAKGLQSEISRYVEKFAINS